MPRGARLDTPGTLLHVIVRGIERRNIVDDDLDRENWVARIGRVADETQTAIYAWALMSNHAHMLIRSGIEEKGDARILSASEFVNQVIDEAEQQVKHQLAGKDLIGAARGIIRSDCSDHHVSIKWLRSGNRRQAVSNLRKQLTLKLENELGLTSEPDSVTITVGTPPPPSLNYGDLVSGVISAAGEEDLYTFTGSNNESVLIAITQDSGFAGSPVPNLTLFSPSGAVVNGTSYSANCQPRFDLTEDGTYVIRVRANDLVSTGAYSVGLELE